MLLIVIFTLEYTQHHSTNDAMHILLLFDFVYLKNIIKLMPLKHFFVLLTFQMCLFNHIRSSRLLSNCHQTKQVVLIIIIIIAEHLKYASARVSVLIAVRFTGLLVHDILPDSMIIFKELEQII